MCRYAPPEHDRGPSRQRGGSAYAEIVIAADQVCPASDGAVRMRKQSTTVALAVHPPLRRRRRWRCRSAAATAGVVAADDPIGGLKEKVSLCAHASGLLSSSTRGSSGDMPLV